MSNRFYIDIDLYATGGDPLPDPDALQTTIAGSLNEWWTAMGLGGEPAVRIQSKPVQAELFDFAVRFGDQPVPVPVYYANRRLAPLPFRIVQALIANRVHFLNTEQLRALRHQCLEAKQLPAPWHSAPLAVWHGLASRLLGNGFSLNRLGSCLGNWTPEESADETFEALVESPEMLRLTLELSPELMPAAENGLQGLNNVLPDFYTEIFQDRGILLPELVVEKSDRLSTGQFRLRLNDLWMPALNCPGPGQALYASDDPNTGFYLPSLNTFYTTDPGKDPFRAPDIADAQTFILEWMRYCTREFAAWYVNGSIVEGLLDNLEENNRSLVVMIREQWPTHRLCTLLRRLLDEQVSMRNLPEILDVLLRVEGPLPVDDTEYLVFFPPVSRIVTIPPGALTGPGLSLDQWVSQVRANLKFPIVYPYLREGVLPCYNLAPALLRDIRDGFYHQAQALSGTGFYQLLSSLRDLAAADYPNHPVLLTPTGIRPAALAALRPYFPQLAVIGHEELPPFFIPQVKGMIS